MLTVALNVDGAQRLEDHRRGFVEALARLVHRASEGGEFAPRQTAPDAETKAAFGQMVEHRHLLGDA